MFYGRSLLFYSRIIVIWVERKSEAFTEFQAFMALHTLMTITELYILLLNITVLSRVSIVRSLHVPDIMIALTVCLCFLFACFDAVRGSK